MTTPEAASLAAFRAMSHPVLMVGPSLDVISASDAARRRFAAMLGPVIDDAELMSNEEITEQLRDDTALKRGVLRAATARQVLTIRPSRSELVGPDDAIFRVQRVTPFGESAIILIEIHFRQQAPHKIKLLNRELTHLRGRSLNVRRNLQRLASLNQNLSRFAHAAAHDMQEPVRVIAMLSDVLSEEDGGLSPEKRRLYLTSIGEHARRARRIVLDVLQFSRVSEHAPSLETVDLAQVAQAVALEAQTDAAGAQVDVDVGVIDRVRCDRKMFEMVFRNLISNSIKYRRGDAVRITVSAKTEDRFIEICVEDDGVGFENAQADRIFEAFTRLHRHDEVQGSGVGLSLCRSIVERHRGRIWAEGAPGQGARFYIRLPRRGGEATEELAIEPLLESA